MVKTMIEKARDAKYSAYAAVTCELADKENKKAVGVGAGLAAALMTTGVALAATGSIWSDVTNILSTFYKDILGISTAIAFVMCAVCAVWAMTTTNQQSTQKAISTAKKVLVAWFILNLLTSIFNVFITLVRDNGRDENLPTF